LEAPLAEAEAELAQLNTQLTNLPFEQQRAEAAREFAERDYQGKSAARDVTQAEGHRSGRCGLDRDRGGRPARLASGPHRDRASPAECVARRVEIAADCPLARLGGRMDSGNELRSNTDASS
jgi:hypothetical protein